MESRERHNGESDLQRQAIPKNENEGRVAYDRSDRIKFVGKITLYCTMSTVTSVACAQQCALHRRWNRIAFARECNLRGSMGPHFWGRFQHFEQRLKRLSQERGAAVRSPHDAGVVLAEMAR